MISAQTLAQTADPGSFRLDPDGLILVVIVLVVTGVTFAILRHSKKRNAEDDRPRFGMAGCLVTALLLMFFAVAVSLFSFSATEQRTVVHEAADRTEELAAVESNEELWDRFTEPRIKLEPTADEPAAESESDDAAEQIDHQTRPEWVDASPKLVGNVYCQVVSSGPYETVEECHAVLESTIQLAVVKRIRQLVGNGKASQVKIPDLQQIGISQEFIFREICVDEYVEEVDSSFGPMKDVHVQMEFSESVRNQLRQAWQVAKRQGRLMLVAQGAGLLLAGLAAVYGLLKFDTLTRGYYTQRLLWGSGAVIIVIAAILFA